MEVKGMVYNIRPIELAGSMRKQQIILQTSDGERSKYVAIEFLGDKNVSKLGGIQLGDIVTVKVDVSSREWNGKWYTNVNGWSVTKHSAFTPPPPPQPEDRGAEVPKTTAKNTTAADDEDLPF